MALSPAQTRNASLIYGLGRSRGLSDARARELIAGAYAESTLNERARNPSSGAGGLFQLLSSGYVNRARQLGGVNNPRANTLSILPEYISYWRSHPNAAPGEAARDVERSGQGAGFYSAPLRMLTGFQPGSAPAGAPATAGPAPAVAPPANLMGLRQAALQQLMAQTGSAHPDYSGFLGALKQLRSAPTAAPPAAGPQLDVQVQKGAKLNQGAHAAVQLAEHYLGTPYHWGGASPETNFDCSGLLQYVWGKQGVNIPRVTYDQWKAGTPVSRSSLQPGDAVFFHPGPSGPEHVGMYVGNGNFIESPHTGAVVRISRLAGRSGYMGARRF